ncbi:MAG: HAMP domain-containing histidine kinase [Endomicrobiales bacterium]|nr:HAMP domain-containing histidine kinase [Endomicrobiales bacterium]
MSSGNDTGKTENNDIPIEAPSFTPEQQEFVNNEKLLTLSKFSSVVSHELKNPLASLKNIGYFLAKTVKTEDQKIKRMLELLGGEVDRMDKMINSLSDISHVRRVNKDKVSVSEVLEKISSEFKPGENISFRKDLEAGIESTADSEKISLLVHHLLKNAREAIDEKGEIVLSLQKTGGSFVITVSDTGSGMDSKTLNQAFFPMFTTRTKTLGMGLTISKEIVLIHKGSIEAKSEKGKGSTFTVTMPII